MSTYKAGCICGAVQLEVTGDPAVQAICHCSSCRGWLSAPIHAAALWPRTSVKVTQGAGNLGLYKKTENSHRQFCRSCGSPVLVGHPGMGMTDVPAGSVAGRATYGYDVRLPGTIGDDVADSIKAAAARGVAVRIAW